MIFENKLRFNNICAQLLYIYVKHGNAILQLCSFHILHRFFIFFLVQKVQSKMRKVNVTLDSKLINLRCGRSLSFKNSSHGHGYFNRIFSEKNYCLEVWYTNSRRTL